MSLGDLGVVGGKMWKRTKNLGENGKGTSRVWVKNRKIVVHTIGLLAAQAKYAV